MQNILFTILLVLLLVNIKWVLIALLLPFQALNNKRLKQKQTSQKPNPLLFALCAPYVLFERWMRYGWERYMLFQVAEFPSRHVRRWIYALLGAEVGPKAVFHFRTEIRQPTKLVVGKGTIIGDNVILDARGGLEIGDNVCVSSRVSIYTLQHDHRNPQFLPAQWNAKVRIGNRVWLGSNVIVLPGVTIGEGAVCCAGCVVTKDVAPYSVVAGMPARKVNERPRHLTYQFSAKTSRLY